jgi:hypothetical protein
VRGRRLGVKPDGRWFKTEWPNSDEERSFTGSTWRRVFCRELSGGPLRSPKEQLSGGALAGSRGLPDPRDRARSVPSRPEARRSTGPEGGCRGLTRALPWPTAVLISPRPTPPSGGAAWPTWGTQPPPDTEPLQPCPAWPPRARGIPLTPMVGRARISVRVLPRNRSAFQSREVDSQTCARQLRLRRFPRGIQGRCLRTGESRVA